MLTEIHRRARIYRRYITAGVAALIFSPLGRPPARAAAAAVLPRAQQQRHIRTRVRRAGPRANYTRRPACELLVYASCVSTIGSDALLAETERDCRALLRSTVDDRAIMRFVFRGLFGENARQGWPRVLFFQGFVLETRL